MQQKVKDKRVLMAFGFLIPVVPEAWFLLSHSQSVNVQLFLGYHESVPIKFKLSLLLMTKIVSTKRY